MSLFCVGICLSAPLPSPFIPFHYFHYWLWLYYIWLTALALTAPPLPYSKA